MAIEMLAGGTIRIARAENLSELQLAQCDQSWTRRRRSGRSSNALRWPCAAHVIFGKLGALTGLVEKRQRCCSRRYGSTAPCGRFGFESGRDIWTNRSKAQWPVWKI